MAGETFRERMKKKKRSSEEIVRNKISREIATAVKKAQGIKMSDGQQKTLRGVTVAGKSVQVKGYMGQTYVRMSGIGNGKGEPDRIFRFKGNQRYGADGMRTIFSGSLKTTGSKKGKIKASTGSNGG